MGRVNDTFSNVNAAFRNLLLMVLIGGAGFFGYKGYELYNEPQKALADKEMELQKQQHANSELQKANADLEKGKAELDAKLKEQIAANDKLTVKMNLLKVRHRMARLKVLDQKPIPPADNTAAENVDGKSPATLMTKIEFAEINEDGQPIGEPKQFDIVGDMVYVDYLRVAFDDKYIEENDLDRNTSIAFFQRIFGEHQEPTDGFHLDTVGTRPNAYGRGTEMSEFERKIWDDFWLIANDRKCAEELGIHAAHTNAVGMRVQPGKAYEIDLRSTGDMTFVPVEPKPVPAAHPGSSLE